MKPLHWLALAALALSNAAPSHANLITNGNFDQGEDGWTVTSPGGMTWALINNTLCHSNNSCAIFGEFVGTSLGSFQQNVTTTPGQQYWFSFWAQGVASSEGDWFEAFFGGQSLLQLEQGAYLDWTKYSFKLTAASSTTSILFQGRNWGSTFQMTM